MIDETKITLSIEEALDILKAIEQFNGFLFSVPNSEYVHDLIDYPVDILTKKILNLPFDILTKE